jgi:hypothetical protein
MFLLRLRNWLWRYLLDDCRHLFRFSENGIVLSACFFYWQVIIDHWCRYVDVTLHSQSNCLIRNCCRLILKKKIMKLTLNNLKICSGNHKFCRSIAWNPVYPSSISWHYPFNNIKWKRLVPLPFFFVMSVRILWPICTCTRTMYLCMGCSANWKITKNYKPANEQYFFYSNVEKKHSNYNHGAIKNAWEDYPRFKKSTLDTSAKIAFRTNVFARFSQDSKFRSEPLIRNIVSSLALC